MTKYIKLVSKYNGYCVGLTTKENFDSMSVGMKEVFIGLDEGGPEDSISVVEIEGPDDWEEARQIFMEKQYEQTN
jgi:hypothetical protein